MTDSLNEIIQRDLSKLIKEVNSYQDEAALWLTAPSISNSAGSLTLHICGNLQHFIGAVLGNTEYIRQRDQEFERKNIPISVLINDIQTTSEAVKDTLDKLSTEQLQATYPINAFKKEMTTEYFLLHLSSHLSYHLGQVNYHRRLLDK